MLKNLDGARVSQLVIPIFIALAPVATVILTYPDPGDVETPGRLFRSFVMPLLAVELFVALFALLTRLRQFRLPSRRWLLVWAALVVIAWCTAFFGSVSQPSAIIRTAFWTIHLFFGVGVYHLAVAGEVKRSDMLGALLAGFVLAAIALLTFTQALRDPAAFDWVHNLPGYDHFRRIGYYGAAIAGLCLGHFALRASPGRHAASFAVSALAFALIFWSGSRGALLAWLGAFAAMVVLIPAARRLYPMVLAFGSIAVGAAASLLLVMGPANMGLARTIGLTTSVSSGAKLSSGRTELWQDAWHAFLERPIFGYGEAQTHFILPTAERLGSIHPHNALFQFLLAWGLVGTLLAAALFLPWLVRAVGRARAPGADSLPWIGGIFALIAFSAIDGTLFHVLPLAIMAICIAMVQAEARKA